MSQTQDVIIRRASADDVPTIAAITAAAYANYVPLLGRKPKPMTADYDQILTDQPIWLLCLDDQPAGVLVLMKEPEHLLIYNVAVSPAYQKQGWGRRLLEWAEQEARCEGYTLPRLYTNTLMVGNIALYQRLGYVETRREPTLTQPWFIWRNGWMVKHKPDFGV